ncbi:28S ribosomal protein S24-A, mitochondrial-like [Orbicella faveolata]|uniref:28S ribosomal protein S24-A, mitochondrial-like n=1 Tax=Orbicella faveolata TaxID=48498 RepID=UPI0009E30E6E|nr:28S ribosomal protein S24-A, mitochondrial-like [Orbicella faveolata]XP_020625586.1 28S ribosomal protein S24-A, mitochondrial-like [Orbicella faveolata]
MAANGCRNFLKQAGIQGLNNVYRSGNLGTCRSVACFPAFGVAPAVSGILGVRYAYQPKQKQQQKRNEVPSYRIGVTRSQDSLHTGSLKGSLWASERLLDDIMIRKFVEGVMHEFVESEVVIKRRANNIILVFLVSIYGDVKKFYFLVGFTEKLLTELLGCIVKVEAQSYSGRQS